MLSMISPGEQEGQRPAASAPPGPLSPMHRAPQQTHATTGSHGLTSGIECATASGCGQRWSEPHPSPVVARRCAMLGAAPTPRGSVTAIAGCVAAIAKPWTYCVFAVRARVHQAVATQKHHQRVATHACPALLHRPVVMLVESDV